MTLSLNNLKFIIVTFKSDYIINECIESLPKDSNIIIIENSNNLELKKNLKQNILKLILLFKKILEWGLQIIKEFNCVKQIMPL